MPGVGVRIRERRVKDGVTQAQVAEALALDASAVSRIEKGERQLSAFELGVLADTFGWDARQLLGLERPQKKLAVAARLRQMDGSPLHAFARLAALVEVDALLDEAGASDGSTGLRYADVLPVPANMAAAEREGREFAETIRDKAGAADGISDLVGFAEVHLGLDVLIIDLQDGCDGAVATGERVAATVLDASAMSGRQRFTLAHEIGHALMGDVVDTVHVDRGGTDSLVEVRANTFAANLLLPAGPMRTILGSDPGPAELVEAMVAFGVSWTALRRRCDDIQIEISEQFRDLTGPQLFALAGRSAEEERVSAPIPPRIPARLDRRVRSAYSQALIGAGVVAMAFGAQGEMLDELLASIPLVFELPTPTKSAAT